MKKDVLVLVHCYVQPLRVIITGKGFTDSFIIYTIIHYIKIINTLHSTCTTEEYVTAKLFQ